MWVCLPDLSLLVGSWKWVTPWMHTKNILCFCNFQPTELFSSWICGNMYLYICIYIWHLFRQIFVPGILSKNRRLHKFPPMWLFFAKLASWQLGIAFFLGEDAYVRYTSPEFPKTYERSNLSWFKMVYLMGPEFLSFKHELLAFSMQEGRMHGVKQQSSSSWHFQISSISTSSPAKLYLNFRPHSHEVV